MRALPHDLGAEKAVLGALLLKPGAIAEVADDLRPEDFHHPAHEAIAVACLALAAANKPIDPVAVADELRRADSADRLRGVGGEAYLVALLDGVITVDSLPHHVAIVRRLATARRLVETAQAIVADGLGEDAGGEDFADESERAILAVTSRHAPVRYESAKTTLGRVIANVEEAHEGRQRASKIATGLAALDGILRGGIAPGDLVIVGGRPGMGKTSLATGIAFDAAIRDGVAALIFSLEMDRSSLLVRALASRADLDGNSIEDGRLRPSEWSRLHAAGSEIAAAPVWIDDRALDLAGIVSTARRWRGRPEEGGRERAIVVVDYLQLVKVPGDKRKGSNREQDVAEASRTLKLLARDLRLPVVALSQLNRAVEARTDKRPTMADLRESGAIEQDADVIAFCYRDAVYNEKADPRAAEIIVAKQRKGPCGTANVRWSAPSTRFDDGGAV